MKCSFSKDVYLVQGKARSCIYDLARGNLYSISGQLAERIEQLRTKGISDKLIDPELKDILSVFLSRDLLTECVQTDNSSIQDIADQETHIKVAWVEITTRCNMQCVHCYNESTASSFSDMSIDDYKTVIDSIVDLGVHKIVIIGGEPFVRKNDLKEMLDYSVKKIDYIEVFTNGTLITDDWYDYFRRKGIRIALSVYSYIPDAHDSVTGCSGSWKKTNETIHKLHNHGIPYRVCNTLINSIEIGDKNESLYTLSLKKDIVRMAGRASFKLLSDDLIEKKLITKDTFKKPISKEYIKRVLSGHNCFGSKIYISAEMEVYPCVMERRISHCRIEKGKRIMLSDSILHMTKDKITGCCECEYRYACFDCRPDSLSGQLNEKPWYCTYEPSLGVWLDKTDFVRALKAQWG